MSSSWEAIFPWAGHPKRVVQWEVSQKIIRLEVLITMAGEMAQIPIIGRERYKNPLSGFPRSERSGNGGFKSDNPRFRGHHYCNSEKTRRNAVDEFNEGGKNGHKDNLYLESFYKIISILFSRCLKLCGKVMSGAENMRGYVLGKIHRKYVIPAILHIIKQHSRRPMRCEPKVLVLAPTRELALQIRSVFVELERYSGIYSCCMYGGSSKRYQLEEYHNGAEVMIATPGRLNDFLCSNEVSVKQITFLILDEDDRMLDLGFSYQISEIIEQMEGSRTTFVQLTLETQWRVAHEIKLL